MPMLKKMRMIGAHAIFGVMLSLAFFASSQAHTPAPSPVSSQAKTPVIIIPGLTGSELVNQKTGEVVWFKAPRSKDDDLRLPISSVFSRNRDNLVAGDILRSIKPVGILPRIDVYGSLIDAFKNTLGYHEEFWDTPTPKGDEKAIYVFPYDWRLDNVENARLLIRKIVELKAKLKRPDLKFNVIGHSMGGIIARYASMYGDADLPAGNRKAVPTWAGAKHFNRVVLMGTPSEGSALSLSSMINGTAIGGLNINLPFVQNISKYDVFTIPSSYQLLPAPGTFQAVDENFEPLSIDLYDPKAWTKYGWNAIDDKGFPSQFKVAERRNATSFFNGMLLRAKHFHEALSAGTANGEIKFEILGADCTPTLDTVLIYRDRKSNKWKTLFKPSGFTKNGGEKVTAEELKTVMLSAGDGVVTTRSLETGTQSKMAKVPSLLNPEAKKFICEEHNKLGANTDAQTYLIGLFND